MQYKFSIENKERYVRVEITGTRIREGVEKNMKHIFSKITDYCREHSNFRILIITNLLGSISYGSVIDLIEYAMELGWDQKFRVANVDLNIESCNKKRAVNVMINNPVYESKIFINEPRAINWLLES